MDDERRATSRVGPSHPCRPLCDHAVMREILLLLPLLAGPSPKPASKPAGATSAAAASYAVSTVTLPGGGADGIGMDVMPDDRHETPRVEETPSDTEPPL